MRTGRAYYRHKALRNAWRQVMEEAGADIPHRNVERLLRDTHLLTDPADERRMDLVATNLEIYNGPPLFVDVTCLLFFY